MSATGQSVGVSEIDRSEGVSLVPWPSTSLSGLGLWLWPSSPFLSPRHCLVLPPTGYAWIAWAVGQRLRQQLCCRLLRRPPRRPKWLIGWVEMIG